MNERDELLRQVTNLIRANIEMNHVLRRDPERMVRELAEDVLTLIESTYALRAAAAPQ